MVVYDGVRIWAASYRKKIRNGSPVSYFLHTSVAFWNIEEYS